MSAAETAYEEAERAIAKALREGGETLDLSGEKFHALTHLPPEIARLTALRSLDLRQTAVADIAPLAHLTALQRLFLNQTAVADIAPLARLTALQDLSLELAPVADLRPLAGLNRLGTNGPPGLTFWRTTATQADGELARLAGIEDTKTRARATLAYLNTLPPWPQPYTPKSRPDGKPPEPIGRGEVPAIPTPAPAPLQVVEEGGVLRPAMPGDALDAQSRLWARQGWEALRDFLADLAEMRPRIGNQMPTMDKALARFEAGLGADFGQVNPIALGTHGNRIIRLANTAEESLSAADAAELVELAAAIALFLERFPEWRAYREDALSHPLSAEEVQAALPPIDAIAEELFDRAEIDPEIGRNLKDQLAAVREEAGDALSAKGLIASARNVLGRLAEAAVRSGKSGAAFLGREAANLGKMTWEISKKTVATGLSAAALDIFANKARLLHLLATTMPEQFGWLDPILKLIGL